MWIWIKGLVSSWQATDELIRANQLGDYFIQWLNYCDCHVDEGTIQRLLETKFRLRLVSKISRTQPLFPVFSWAFKKGIFFSMTVIHFLCFAFRLKSASFVKGVSVFGQER